VNQQSASDEIIQLERLALDRWGRGDPNGFLELYAADVSYFDPSTASRLDGQAAMVEYYRPWQGVIHVEWYDMLNPQVVIEGNMALLTYNLVNYGRDDDGNEVVASAWNSTSVFRRDDGQWRSIHSHWSFTRHKALQDLTLESSEQQGG
jgi:ketosteroid isomerase-like protein